VSNDPTLRAVTGAAFLLYGIANCSKQYVHISFIISYNTNYNNNNNNNNNNNEKPRKNLETVPGKHLIDSLQKTAILETSHIIRKVLQCEA